MALNFSNGNGDDDIFSHLPPEDDSNDPIKFYKDFKERYYFHHSYYEKHWLSVEEYKRDIELHPHCYSHRRGEQGCIPQCELYDMNPTAEQALTAIKAYFPDWPQSQYETRRPCYECPACINKSADELPSLAPCDCDYCNRR